MTINNDDDYDDFDDQPRPSIEDEGVTMNSEMMNSEENSSVPPEQQNNMYVQTSAYLVEDNNNNIEIAEAEQVRPFFQRKEGQLTVIIVGLLVAAVAISLGVFLTRDEGGDVLLAAIQYHQMHQLSHPHSTHVQHWLLYKIEV